MKNKKIHYIILLIFTVLVLYFSLKDDFAGISSAILKMNPLWLVFAIVLMLIFILFKAVITKTYVNFYREGYTLSQAFRLRVETMFFDGITPFSSGGGPYHIVSLKKAGVRIINGANVMVISSLLYQLSLCTLMTISVLLNLHFNLFKDSITVRNFSIFGYIVCFLVLVCLLLIMFNRKFNESIVKFVIKLLNKVKIVKNKDEVIQKWKDYVDSLNEGSKLIRKDRKSFIKCYIYSLLGLFAYTMIPYTIARGMNITSFGLLETFITTSYVLMIGMFVPIPGGTGGMEYSFSNLYSNFIFGPTVNAVMLVWRFLTYYLGIIVGGIMLNVRKRK